MQRMAVMNQMVTQMPIWTGLDATQTACCSRGCMSLWGAMWAPLLRCLHVL